MSPHMSRKVQIPITLYIAIAQAELHLCQLPVGSSHVLKPDISSSYAVRALLERVWALAVRLKLQSVRPQTQIFSSLGVDVRCCCIFPLSVSLLSLLAV